MIATDGLCAPGAVRDQLLDALDGCDRALFTRLSAEPHPLHESTAGHDLQ